MTTNDDVYSFSAFRYDIVQCDYKRLGNPVLHKDVNFDWNADVNNRFSFWNHSRIWCVTKGSGYVKTTFEEWELQEGFAYYIPQSTLVETRCDDYMVQYFIDFLPITDFIPKYHSSCFFMKMGSEKIWEDGIIFVPSPRHSALKNESESPFFLYDIIYFYGWKS